MSEVDVWVGVSLEETSVELIQSLFRLVDEYGYRGVASTLGQILDAGWLDQDNRPVRYAEIEVDPDGFHCRKCGQPVRYAAKAPGSSYRISLDAKPVANGGFRLAEEEKEGVVTGDWVASYTKVADRNGEPGFRLHDCPAKRSS